MPFLPVSGASAGTGDVHVRTRHDEAAGEDDADEYGCDAAAAADDGSSKTPP